MPVLDQTMRRHNGVARMTTLQREGHTRHLLRRAISDGRLERIRPGWVCVPGADRELVTAARTGSVLTCVTQARRLGLWVLHEDEPHVATDPHGSTPRIDGRLHWALPPVRRHPDAITDPIENVLVLVAACQPHEAALAVWESALRMGAVSKDALARLPLTAHARRLLREAMITADSGLETIVHDRLHWLGVRIVPQAWVEGHRVDFLIGDRLVVQIDGGTHVGAQRNADNAHDAALMLRGYHVIRIGYRQVIDDWAGVQDVIVRAVAQNLHRRAA
ncbi:DUF559 domain-containing protein [Agromyces archimandritae]|uniref:DUF559 domain-containing protein n=1 Tax=Agromyces archimandritae TaxID=2781962 RepID=A0A975FMK5_9MICO|nr:DUF559 domain-containing protein [Agromyces archimandritae]QTX04664.1 DUF559 domain-containing protein [Agromyces archimandritae]